MNAELQFLSALQGLHTPARDAVMLFFTRLGNAGFVWIVLAAILLLFRRTRRAGCILALALVCDLVLCNFILKPLVHRVRPCDLLPEVTLLIPHPSDYSFPSGHTAASFTAVAALWLAGKKRLAGAALVLAGHGLAFGGILLSGLRAAALMLGIGAAGTVLGTSLAAALTVVLKKGSLRGVMKGVATFWLFALSHMALTLLSFVKKERTWRPIAHTNTARIEDLTA